MPFADPILEARRLAGVEEQTAYDELYNRAEAEARARHGNYFEPPPGNPASLWPSFLSPLRQPVRAIEEVPWQRGVGPSPEEQAAATQARTGGSYVEPGSVPVGRSRPAPAVGGATPAAPQTATQPLDFETPNRTLELALRSAYGAPEAVRDVSPAALRERLGFSWGKNVELGPEGRPTSDSMLYRGVAGVPHADAPDVQGHESTGGGGFSQTALKDIPFNQWPESEKRAAFQAAQLQKAQTEAADPFQTRAYGERRAIDALVEQATQGQAMGRDRQEYAQRRAELDAALRAIDASPLPDLEKQKRRALAQDRFDSDWQAYQQARLAARSGALPSTLYRQGF